MEEGGKQVSESGPKDSFFKDPWKAGMAFVIVILLIYIAVNFGGQQAPNTGNQTGGNLTGNTTVNQSGGKPVNLIIVNDNSCILCNTGGIESSLKSIIPSLVVTNVSYLSSEGKALLQQYNTTGVPLYVFDSSIEQDQSFGKLSMYLQKSGSTYMLMVHPVKLVNTVEQNNTIQLFIMSHSGYGVIAENNTWELLNAIPDLKFGGIYFIANDLGNGSFSSLHGDSEVQEDLRQVCIMQYYPETIMNYTSCIAADYNNSGTIWQTCSIINGMNTTQIQECATGKEGKTLLSNNVFMSNHLGIFESPTILLDNDILINGNYATSAEVLKEVVCVNRQLNGCNKTLSGTGFTNQGIGSTG